MQVNGWEILDYLWAWNWKSVLKKARRSILKVSLQSIYVTRGRGWTNFPSEATKSPNGILKSMQIKYQKVYSLDMGAQRLTENWGREGRVLSQGRSQWNYRHQENTPALSTGSQHALKPSRSSGSWDLLSILLEPATYSNALQVSTDSSPESSSLGKAISTTE